MEDSILSRKIFFVEVKEKEENFWRRKTLFCGGEGKVGKI